MSQLNMTWILSSSYDKKSETMAIEGLEEVMESLGFNEKKIVLHADDIMRVIHRYDLRKISYFSNEEIRYTFDTVIRFKKPSGSLIRTVAVCSQNEEGFACIHMFESDVIRMKRSYAFYPMISEEIGWEKKDADWVHAVIRNQEMPEFKQHLMQMMKR